MYHAPTPTIAAPTTAVTTQFTGSSDITSGFFVRYLMWLLSLWVSLCLAGITSMDHQVSVVEDVLTLKDRSP